MNIFNFFNKLISFKHSHFNDYNINNDTNYRYYIDSNKLNIAKNNYPIGTIFRAIVSRNVSNLHNCDMENECIITNEHEFVEHLGNIYSAKSEYYNNIKLSFINGEVISTKFTDEINPQKRHIIFKDDNNNCPRLIYSFITNTWATIL